MPAAEQGRPKVVGNPNELLQWLDSSIDSVRHLSPDTVIFGDSIMGSKVASGSTATYLNVWLSIVSRGRINRLVSAAVPGDTTTAMLARLQVDVLDQRPSIVIMDGGINDMSGSLAVFRSNMETMLTRMKQAGIVPVVISVLPRVTLVDAISAAVAWEAEYCARNGIIFVDAHTPLSTKTGAMNPTYDLGDGIHLNQTGQEVLAQLVWSKISHLYPADRLALARANMDPDNLVPNGLFLVDINADGTPDSWTATSTVVPSIDSSDTTIIGNWLVLTPTGSGARSMHAVVSSGFAVGDVLSVSGIGKVTAVASTMQWTVYIQARDAANSAISDFTLGRQGRPFYRMDIVYPPSGHFVFEDVFIVPPGTVTLRVYLLGETGTGSARFGQIALRNKTALNLV